MVMRTRRAQGEVKARKSHSQNGDQREPTEDRGEVETSRRDEQGRQSPQLGCQQRWWQYGTGAGEASPAATSRGAYSPS